MSYITNRKRKPPMSEAQLNLLDLLQKAQTLGARRTLALAVRDGKYDDGRKVSEHWASTASAKEAYQKARDEVMKTLGPGYVGDDEKAP